MPLFCTAGLSANGGGRYSGGPARRQQCALRDRPVCPRRTVDGCQRPLHSRLCGQGNAPPDASAAQSQNCSGETYMSSDNLETMRLNASVVDAAITSRRATRAFTQAPVSRQTITDLLQVASRAPSGSNTQPWKVYVLTGASRAALAVSYTHLRAHETDSY